MELSAEGGVKTYAKMVYRLAFAQLRSGPDADDVFQEVFLRYVSAGRSFESEEHRKAWLLRVTVNCCRKVQTSPWRTRTEPLNEELPFTDPEKSELFTLVGALPPPYRGVLHLYYYEGYSTEEIGTILGRRAATVRSQLVRGRAILKRDMEGAREDEK